MRELQGYTSIECVEFQGENLSDALGEMALFCARREAEGRPPEFKINQQYDVEEGRYIIFLFVME